MKVSLEVPAHLVEFFSDLSAIVGEDWKALLENYLDILEIIPRNCRGAVADESMQYASSKDEAKEIAGRAVDFLKKEGLSGTTGERLLLLYDLNSGNLDFDDFEILDEAEKILECPMVCGELEEEDAEDNEGEEWKLGV